MRIIARGIDTLVLTYVVCLHPSTYEELGALRELARTRRETKDKTPVVIRRAGVTFVVGTGAKAPFRNILTAEDEMTVAVAGQDLKGGTPTVKVELRSEYLWTLGYVHAVERARGLVWSFILGTLDAPEEGRGCPGTERVFRVDLTVDVQGWTFDGRDEEDARWRCRAEDKVGGHGNRGRSWTGYSKGLGGDVGFRAYDKTREMGDEQSRAYRERVRAEARAAKRQDREPRRVDRPPCKKEWFRTVVWSRSPEYDPDAHVWRFEAQLRGAVLKELAVRDGFLEVFAHQVDAVWRHVVGSPEWAPERSGGKDAAKREEGRQRGDGTTQTHNKQGAWISYREHLPVGAPNPARAPVDPRWRKLQSVVFVAEAAPAIRTRARTITEERAFTGLRGYFSSWLALQKVRIGLGADPAELRRNACELLEVRLRQYDATSTRTLIGDVRDKREAKTGGSYRCAVCDERARRAPRRYVKAGVVVWASCKAPSCRATILADVREQLARSEGCRFIGKPYVPTLVFRRVKLAEVPVGERYVPRNHLNDDTETPS